jgi:hypothetical protein
MDKTIRTSQEEFSFTLFVKLVTAHLLKKSENFIISPNRDPFGIKILQISQDT